MVTLPPSAGQGPSGGGNGQVVGSGQPGDAVEKDHHILTVFSQPPGTLQYHLRHLDMVLGLFIKGGVDDLPSAKGALHLRDLFRTLVHQEYDQFYFRVFLLDAPGNVLQKGGLAGLRRGYDQSALPLSDGGDDVD